jgi:hypothetical protein
VIVSTRGQRLALIEAGKDISVAVPTASTRTRTGRFMHIRDALYFGVYYPAAHRGPLVTRAKRVGRQVRYSLPWPRQEWLAVAIVMMRWVAEGASWDMAKAAVHLAATSIWGKKPGPEGARRKTRLAGLSWTRRHPSDGVLEEVFVGLKTYEEYYDRQRARLRQGAVQLVDPSLAKSILGQSRAGRRRPEADEGRFAKWPGSGRRKGTKGTRQRGTRRRG